MKTKTYQQALESGSTIESFEIVDVLGAGGFGITYKAIDKDLNYEVAVKEYLPGEYSWRVEGKTVVPKSSEVTEEYEYGLDRFLDEGRTLAKFKHPNIVRVVRYLRANGTGYLVMDYEYGQTLHEYLLLNPGPEEKVLLNIAISILRGLSHIHSHGFLHRDVKPGNIYLRKKGEALLIDFGAARHSVGEHSQSMTGIVTAGYAPFEQYSVRARQGPSCDLYALGATLYRSILGVPPVEAPDRIAALQEGELDPLTPAIELGLDEYSDIFLQAIDWMLQPLSKDRPQSAMEVMAIISPEDETDEKPTVAVADVTRVSRRSRPRRKVSIHKRLIFLFSLLSLLVVLLVAWIYWSGLSPLVNNGEGVQGQNTTQLSVVNGKNPKVIANKRSMGLAPISATMGYLSIVSKPSQAKIFIDNAYAGETPFTNKLISIGPHKIKLVKSGYNQYQEKIYIVSKNHSQLNLTLKITTAFFTLNTTPKNSVIKFEDSSLIYKAGMELPVGKYKVSISAPGYKTRHMLFPVAWGKTLQGTTYRKSFSIALKHNRLLRQYNFKKYGNVSGVRYVSGLKLLLISIINRNQLYLIDIAPKTAMTKKDRNPTGSVSVSFGKSIKAVDLDKPQKEAPYKYIARFYTRGGSAFTLLDNRKKLLVGSSKGRVVLYDLVSRKVLYIFRHQVSKPISAVSLSRDEKRMAVTIGTSLYIWDMSSKKQVLLGPVTEKVSKILITPDNKSLIVYRWYRPFFERISLQDENFRPEVRFEGISRGLYNLVMSEDNKLIYTAGLHNTIKAWDIKTAALIKTFKGHTGSVRYVALHRNKLYSVSRDRTLRIWDVKSTKQLFLLEGHTSKMGGVDVAEDGTIVTGDSSGKVFFWK